MDIREFSNKLMEATQNMSPSEREALIEMFESVSNEITKDEDTKSNVVCENNGQIPDGITTRLMKLKENYLKQVPKITIHRAKAITKIAKENPGAPKAILRGKSFKYCCETAPLVR